MGIPKLSEDYKVMSWLVITPPLLALTIALWKKNVILALLAGLFLSEFLLQNFHPGLGFLHTIERIVITLTDADNSRILLFSLLVGVLIAYMHDSGGVTAFIQTLERKQLVKNKKQAGLMPALVGIFIFLESSLSILTAGILSRDLFDKFKLTRLQLAYIIDSTCAPICVLILINGWGALLLGLLQGYDLKDPLQTLLWTIPYNFYAWLTVIIVFISAWRSQFYGPLAKPAKKIHHEKTEPLPKATHAFYVYLPIIILISSVFFFMWYTGQEKGSMLQGSGTKSVLWGVCLALLFFYCTLHFHAKQKHQTLIKLGFKGMSQLLPLVTIVLISLALGASLKILGTGHFIANLLQGNVATWLITPFVFVIACLMAFTTGTSWGTFAILTPIGMPVALQLGLPPELIMSAIIGGSVFGDHCSPISDTTIISSMAAGCDHLEHVSSQLPYALLTGTITLFIYILIGLFL